MLFSARLYKYYSIKHLRKNKTPIHNVLLKYGFANFSLDILEFCDINDCILRKQFYFDLLKPDYNVLEKAGSSLGFRHKEETIHLFKNERKVSKKTRDSLFLAAMYRVLTEAEKTKISVSRLGKKLSDKTRNKISVSMSAISGVQIVVKDINTNVEKEYLTLTKAAEALDVSRTAVAKALNY